MSRDNSYKNSQMCIVTDLISISLSATLVPPLEFSPYFLEILSKCILDLHRSRKTYPKISKEARMHAMKQILTFSSNFKSCFK
jgi:hypothetical protein